MLPASIIRLFMKTAWQRDVVQRWACRVEVKMRSVQSRGGGVFLVLVNSSSRLAWRCGVQSEV